MANSALVTVVTVRWAKSAGAGLESEAIGALVANQRIGARTDITIRIITEKALAILSIQRIRCLASLAVVRAAI